MSKLRRMLIRWITVLQVLCVLAAVLFWHIVHERKLETINLPSGDKVVIVYHPSRHILHAIMSAGGLRYRIYSGHVRQSGELTHDLCYDVMSDVKLYYDVQGGRQVLIADGRGGYWQFCGDSAGKYDVVDFQKAHRQEKGP